MGCVSLCPCRVFNLPYCSSPEVLVSVFAVALLHKIVSKDVFWTKVSSQGLVFFSTLAKVLSQRGLLCFSQGISLLGLPCLLLSKLFTNFSSPGLGAFAGSTFLPHDLPLLLLKIGEPPSPSSLLISINFHSTFLPFDLLLLLLKIGEPPSPSLLILECANSPHHISLGCLLQF